MFFLRIVRVNKFSLKDEGTLKIIASNFAKDHNFKHQIEQSKRKNKQFMVTLIIQIKLFILIPSK